MGLVYSNNTPEGYLRQQYTAVEGGNATSGTSTTIVDTTKNWDVNVWQYYLLAITVGTGAGQARVITANDATSLTVDVAWAVNPDATSSYEVRTPLTSVEAITGSVTIQDATTPSQKAAVNASGQIAIQNEPNMDVALSTRASEATVSAIKTDTDNLDVLLSSRAAASQFPASLAGDGGFETDLGQSTTISPAISLMRWGIPREPTWVDGADFTGPAAGAVLVTKTVTVGKTGRVFGVHIAIGDQNRLQLFSGATLIKEFQIPVGTENMVLPLPILNNVVAGTAITIKPATAGSGSSHYQASLLYDEA